MLIKLLRNALGSVIVFFSWLTKPKAIQRPPEQQALIDEKMQGLSLYQFFACPFCVKTRRALLGVRAGWRENTSSLLAYRRG